MAEQISSYFICRLQTDEREMEEGQEEAENREMGGQDDIPVPDKDAPSPIGGEGGGGGGEGGLTDSVLAGDGGSVVQSDVGGSLATMAGANHPTEEDWKEEESISPFIKTAAYLLDVHAIKVSLCLC